MTTSIVVCIRALELEVEPKEHLAAARALGERALALGARLISWSAALCAFEFEPDAAQEAIELALSAVRGSAGGQAAVGVSQGPLEGVEDATVRLSLRWGHSLVRATALARAARAGEVLLDPSLEAVERGELITTGSRVSLYGKLRIRGLILDAAHPWRAAAAADIVGFARPSFIPRDELAEIVSALDGLTLVRAASGFGGTRLLDEAARELEPARCLLVAPEGLGEPLGSLRLAMLRGVNANQAPVGLTSGIEPSLDALLAGEGLDPDSGADLLAAWLAPDASGSSPGVVLIDDAGFVDADTLEVIGLALAKAPEPFRVIARIRATEAVPRALASIPVALEVTLGSLPAAQAEELAALAAGGVMDPRTKTQWAVRGGANALGVVESVREAIEAGEIVWDAGSAAGRARAAVTSGPRPPAYWIRKRFARCDEPSRRVLMTMSILRGHVSRAEILASHLDGSDADPDESLSLLEASGWIKLDKPDLYSLPSAGHRDTIVRSMNDTEFSTAHFAAAQMFGKRDQPLAATSATVHYVLAGEGERAREMARLAAAATRAIGLEATAAGFEALAEKNDLDALSARNFFGTELQAGRQPSRGQRPSRPSDSVRGTRRSRSPASGRPPRASEPPEPVVAEPQPVRALDALRRGDVASVEKLAKELRVDESRAGLADRLQAMADIARGDTGDAIRRLRDAAEEARRVESRDLCRALLALAVALAAANRKEEALLEALDALARAREANDERGEQACVRFLSQLAASAGHPDAGSLWSGAAR